MKKKILFALAAAAVLFPRHGIEKSYRYDDHDGHEHEICFSVNSDYVSIEHYIAGDINDGFFAGIVQHHDVTGYYTWKTWELEAYNDIDAAFIMLSVGPF